MKWELDLWYEMWDRAGSQGLDIWYPVQGGPEAEAELGPVPTRALSIRACRLSTAVVSSGEAGGTGSRGGFRLERVRLGWT